MSKRLPHDFMVSLASSFHKSKSSFKPTVGNPTFMMAYRLFEKNHVVVDPLSHEDNFLHRTIHFWLARAHKGI